MEFSFSTSHPFVASRNTPPAVVLRKEDMVLRWALAFFIVALVAALLGFTAIAVAAAGIAKLIFYLFLALFVLFLLGHLLRRT
jgi:uncharacterized membrane protein YtjA (UPF0391 family)